MSACNTGVWLNGWTGGQMNGWNAGEWMDGQM